MKLFLTITILFSLISLPAAAQVTLESSNLPIVIINTNGQNIPGDHKITADMGIIYNGAGQINHMTDSLNNYNGKIGIEIRGSSSQMFPKKQYAVETRDEYGENLNVSLLDLPEENDWILYAPYSDKSLMRNVLLYHLSNQIGLYASRSKFCELVLNGDYKGVYVLFEKLKRDKNRVDISKLDSTEISGDDLTGGYIIKIDKTDGEEVSGWYSEYKPVEGSSARIFYQYHYPKPDEIVQEQKDYIREFIDHFEDAMYEWDYTDPVSGYQNLIDAASFVDFLLLNEIGKNVDGYRLSAFFNKDKDSKNSLLFAGPVWDFNLAFGNANYYDGWLSNGWQYEINRLASFQYDTYKIPFYWERLTNDSAFVTHIVNRWKELRSACFNPDTIYSFIDETIIYLSEAQERNFLQWPILDEYVWPNYYVGGSYANEISYLKNWIEDRINWMDDMLLDMIPPDTVRNLSITEVTNSSVSIVWDEVSDNQAVCGYDIFINGSKNRYALELNCTIDGLNKAGEYEIEVKARDYAGNYSQGNTKVTAVITDIPGERESIAGQSQLYQNYPNPFNSQTTIGFYLCRNCEARIDLYDLAGRKVETIARGEFGQGENRVQFNSNRLSSGVYFYRLITADGFSQAGKLCVIR
ncbi:MAG: CotH kinase family protein [Calditrichaceae bacterium]|nr:CotH kinase family protein [Calditrichaceae bacterium]MBN2708951.1 CotH kinase family protein [Calditrichaceae bacterium]RQV97526.1 MAG: T9SS C-terminal target domain-containing protein [Calditrichota bacterium]